MKRVWLLLLCAALLTGCAAMRQVFQKEEAPTLWGKQLSFRFVPLPEEAFVSEDNICAAIAPDGKQFLITNYTAPYLWNMETGQKTYLYPAGAQEEELMRVLAGAAFQEEEISSLSGQALLEKYLASAQKGIILGPRSAELNSGDYYGNDMTVADNFGTMWLLDADTGKLYGAKGYSYISSSKDQWMIRELAVTSGLFLKNKETGDTVYKDYTKIAGLEENGAALTAGSFLPDGSIAVVLRENKFDLTIGETCKLVVERPSGDIEVYDLGKILLSREPSLIRSTDGQHIVLANTVYAMATQPMLVNCQSNEVSLLAQKEAGLELVPLEQALDSNGSVLFQKDAGFSLVIDRMSDGKTFLLQGYQGTLQLFQPETGEWTYLFGSFEASSVMMFYTFSSNHYDRFAITTGSERIDRRSYVELTVWEP